MKKFFAIAVIAVSLAACNNSADSDKTGDTTVTVQPDTNTVVTPPVDTTVKMSMDTTKKDTVIKK